MSFWTGKKESLLQSLVEATVKAVLSGLVIALLGRVLLVMVDNQIEVASKRDALNKFRNERLTALTTSFSEAFLAMNCTRSTRAINTNECKSRLSEFATELDSVFLELRVHYPDRSFGALLDLNTQTSGLRNDASNVTQAELDAFSAQFGVAFDEMSQGFR
ncbi:MAG: hypothetical protein AAFN63_00100 [Pseudomonadota bacterium]